MYAYYANFNKVAFLTGSGGFKKERNRKENEHVLIILALVFRVRGMAKKRGTLLGVPIIWIISSFEGEGAEIRGKPVQELLIGRFDGIDSGLRVW